MCESCGCGRRSVSLEEALLSENERIARSNREWFERLGVKVVNLIGSPGAGKTTLIERALDFLNADEVAVIEGDPETKRDAERLEKKGVRVVGVTTGGVCHLDALMVHRAFHRLSSPPPRLLFIENVGNLLCPAEFYLGEDVSVVVYSVTEGEDKPEKYPQAFRKASLVLISKVDLLPYVDFDLERVKELVSRINPFARLVCVSAKTGEGLSHWVDFLRTLA